MAAEAARRALADAAAEPAAVDLLLLATMTPDALTPHGAATVAAAIGATSAGTMDLNAACTGFLAALSLAVGQVESGRAQTVVVIGADAMSRVLDYDDRVTAGIFGDGAGAVVVRAVPGDSQVGPFVLEADGAAGDAIVTPWPAGPVRMEGQRTFRRAVDALVDVALRTTALAGTTRRRPRPRRPPSGQRADHRGGRRAPRPARRACRRLHRPDRQHDRRQPADRTRPRQGRRPPPARLPRPARRLRRRPRLGRGGAYLGRRGVRQPRL